MIRVNPVVCSNVNGAVLNNVFYVLYIMPSLISMSCICKKRNQVTINCDKHERGKIKVLHNVSVVVLMVGFETSEGLYKAVLLVLDIEQTHVTVGTNPGIWYRRLTTVLTVSSMSHYNTSKL